MTDEIETSSSDAVVPTELADAQTASQETTQTYTVAVRALCEFAAKSGDLDLRFTPSPTAKEGIAGHTIVSGRRNAGYEREVSLSGHYKTLTVKGRADGYDGARNCLEEIKTFRGDLTMMPANHSSLHWAQAKIYGWLLCQARALEQLDVALVYFDIVKQKETRLTETCSAEQLQYFFEAHCECFLSWAKQEMEHRNACHVALEAMRFPYTEFRVGQRQLAEAVYKTGVTGGYLLAEAPTGIGKTLGTLFPLLKALPRSNLDKIFFLTAKTPGRRLALDAVTRLQPNPIRTLELVARDKSCEHPDKACHGESCPLAKGFYDRLPAARQAAAGETMLDQQRLRLLALAHNVCPYYLAQEMARWSDLIVGDYNYYFDISALLPALMSNNDWQAALLIDEAHNLFDRARDMYSAELNQLQFRRLSKTVPASLKSVFTKISRQWNALNRQAESEAEMQSVGADSEDYCLLGDPPSKFLLALQAATADITDLLAEQPAGLDSDLLEFYFDALHFLRVAELYDEQTYLFDLTWRKPARGRKASQLCLRNLIPAAQLRQRFQSAETATLFSATLRPPAYYRDVLGLPETTGYLDVPSPFVADQLEVVINRAISTRYRDRSSSIDPIVDLIAKQYLRQPGNYLAFFSSYRYLNQVLERLKSDHRQIPVWTQDRAMDEKARQAFLDKFEDLGQGVGFAVLGGAFAEGVDLPGRRLIGAFIATLGLPQTNPVNEQLRNRMDSLFGDGYNYSYLYPGLRKVVQAAGRVIRTEQDKGIVYLIDDRFAQARVKALLPDWWQLVK